MLVSLVTAGCGSGGAEGEPTDKAAATKEAEAKAIPAPKPSKAAKPKEDPAAWARKMKAVGIESNGDRPIGKGCHLPEYTWQCFFDHVESPYIGRLDVHLSLPGDVTKDEGKDMADKARHWWMNMVGFTEEKLDTVVSFNNGVDSGTSYRRDFPMLN